MADALGPWAERRAHDVVARAEEEAVAVLRDALVAAAVAERRRPPPPPEPEAQPPRSGATALWAYGVVGTARAVDLAAGGVDPVHPVHMVRAGELAAIVSRVPLAEFGAGPLRENLNDLDWLERVARAHEDVLERALATTPCVPLQLCTIYESEESLRAMLDRERASFTDALAQLDGREEWSVKLLVEQDALTAAARAVSDDLEDDGRDRSEGGAYMLQRRIDRRLRERAGALATQAAEEVHARLADWAVDAVTRPPQNRELSGHEGEMVLNGAYLVPADGVDALRALVDELQDEQAALGARLELSGPFPPYNFVPGGAP